MKTFLFTLFIVLCTIFSQAETSIKKATAFKVESHQPEVSTIASTLDNAILVVTLFTTILIVINCFKYKNPNLVLLLFTVLGCLLSLVLIIIDGNKPLEICMWTFNSLVWGYWLFKEYEKI